MVVIVEGILVVLSVAVVIVDVEVSEIVDIIDFSEDKFQDFIDDNLLTIENYKLTIFKKGRLFTRNIAMNFDPLIKQNVGTYSNTI